MQSQKGVWKKTRLGRPVGTHWRTCRWRARQLVESVEVCQWESIGGCSGPIQVAHVDGNFTNNNLSNLLALCTSHHKLMDHGRINPKNPVMPRFYTDAVGHRRYQHTITTKSVSKRRGFTLAEWKLRKGDK